MNIFTTYLFMIGNILLALLPAISSIFVSVASVPHSRSPIPPPRCHEDEQSALLKFKQDFIYPAELPDYADFPIDSWKVNGGKGNCCAWDGVECDSESGHVVGLELCCTNLQVVINSSSSLLRLVHLQKLNLAYNSFNYSQLPSALGSLHELTSLNLSFCDLAGQIPRQIFGLTNLSSLDLSYNSRLELMRPDDMGNLFRSLTKLKKLDLSSVYISSSLGQIRTNSSSLSSLVLKDCCIRGGLPSSFFTLSYLQVLDLSSNSFSGEIPVLIGNMSSLEVLDLSSNSFSGEIPASIGNMSSLEILDLSRNSFSGEIPPSIGNLTHMMELDFSFNKFQGPIPSFADGTQLQNLSLRNNKLNGRLPLSLGNLARLRSLYLSGNHLTGPIPSQLWNLSQLDSLDLSHNNLSGMAFDSDFNATPPLTTLYMASCNLTSFPTLLKKLNKLQNLDLSSNNITGEVPIWFLDLARENLLYLNLTGNSLTGFAGNASVLRWTNLEALDLRRNKLRGSLPLPPESIMFYLVSHNALSGEIPSHFCSRSSMQSLNLGENNLTGKIPLCFTDLMKTLSGLYLHCNKLHGIIPKFPGKDCSLRWLDLHNNQLGRALPESLSGCSELEYLNLGDNMIEGEFPSWLGAIPTLAVLILRSNKFHGSIVESKKVDSDFPALQIIDLSRNNFEGPLPAKYFQFWTSMRASDVGFTLAIVSYEFTMTITNKGMEINYTNIPNELKIIDFSSNNFSGQIPNSTASMTGLISLNFSNNFLSGRIPPSLDSLRYLEVLDLSENKLYGEIPEQLTDLTFLAVFDVSSNNLSGHIPQGKQFDSFKNTSYEGNPGLCGVPLSRTCGPPVPPSPANRKERNNDMDRSIIMEWKAISMGYAVAFVTAAVIGNRIIIVRPTQYIEALGLIERIRWMAIRISLTTKE